MSSLKPLVRMQIQSVIIWLMGLLLLSIWVGGARAALPPKTLIENQVSLEYSIGETKVAANASATVETSSKTPSFVKLYHVVSNNGDEAVPDSWYQTAQGKWQKNQLDIMGVYHDTPALLSLFEAQAFTKNESIVIEVIDFDKNQNAAVADTIEVDVSMAVNGDYERLRLTETGPSTGIFRGIVDTRIPADASRNNGLLVPEKGRAFVVNYQDINDPDDSSSASGFFDPSGSVFVGGTEQAVDGAQITLYSVLTGKPAQIMSPDGLATWPSTVVSGQVVVDSLGRSYRMTAGEYRFPLLSVGDYYLDVLPPENYTFPYHVGNSETGEKGGEFLSHGSVSFDIPLGVFASRLTLYKSVDREQVGLGDKANYSITLTNNDPNYAINAIKVIDDLPAGFHVLKDTIQLDGKALSSDSIVIERQKLSLTLDELKPETTHKITYQVKVSTGAVAGKATNQVQAYFGDNQSSNRSTATLLVIDDMMRDSGFLTGRVYVGCDKKTPLSGVRIYIETGRNTLTDPNGLWHLEGVRLGTHIVRLDENSLASQYTPIICQDNSRNNNSAVSALADLKGSTLVRTDFYVSEDKAQSKTKQAAAKKAKKVVPVVPEVNRELAEKHSQDFAILWPPQDYVPSISSIKLVLSYAIKYKAEVWLNDEKVSYYHFDKRALNANKTHGVQLWRGMDLKAGVNNLKVIYKNKKNKVIKTLARTIIFTGAPVSAELLVEQSVLVADGKNSPELVIKLLDKNGYNMREGAKVYYTLESENYTIDHDEDESAEDEARTYKEYVAIAADNLAHVRLKPTTKADKISLRFYLDNNQEKVISTWLKPDYRDWIMVGFAEGTIGYKRLYDLLGNEFQNEIQQREDGFYKQGQMRFFAKGKIRGDHLMTIAYDSDEQGNRFGNELGNISSPDALYTVYGDNSSSAYDATSARKLYIKLEKQQFVALFGDQKVNLNTTSLGSYKRSLTGLYSQYSGKLIDYQWFASQLEQGYQEDKIRGDDTSGEYFLTQQPIANSESISLETRSRIDDDRLIESLPLQRHIDYEIDYTHKSLFFKQPIRSRDNEQNPVFIVVRYESESAGDALTTGGRIALKRANDSVEVGLTGIYETQDTRSDGETDAHMFSADATWKPTENTTFKAEIGRSEREGEEASAWMLDLKNKHKNLETHVYVQDIDEDFGVANQNVSGKGKQKAGVNAEWIVNKGALVKLQAYRENQSADADEVKRHFIQLETFKTLGKSKFKVGVRHFDEQTVDTQGLKVNRSQDQLLLGVNAPLSKRLSMQLDYEKSIDSNGIESESDHSDKLLSTFNYSLNEHNKFVLSHELNLDDIQSSSLRAGVSSRLWQGSTLGLYLNNQDDELGQRTSLDLSANQHLTLSEALGIDLSIKQSKRLSEFWLPQESSDTEDDTEVDASTINSTSADYIVYGLAANWKNKTWKLGGRYEYFDGEEKNKINTTLNVEHKMSDSIAMKLGLKYNYFMNSDDYMTTKKELRIGTAWRPIERNFEVLNNLSYSQDTQQTQNEAAKVEESFKHNIHFSYAVDNRGDIQLQHGIKHSLSSGDNDDSSTLSSGFVGINKDITPRMRLGVHGSYFYDHDLDSQEYGYGAELSLTPFKHAWITLGYNLKGFDDEDVLDSQFSEQGPYIGFKYRLER